MPLPRLLLHVVSMLLLLLLPARALLQAYTTEYYNDAIINILFKDLYMQHTRFYILYIIAYMYSITVRAPVSAIITLGRRGFDGFQVAWDGI